MKMPIVLLAQIGFLDLQSKQSWYQMDLLCSQDGAWAFQEFGLKQSYPRIS